MLKYKLSNDLAQAHNIDAIKVIDQVENSRGVKEQRFGISIELFPDTPYKTGDIVPSRIDCYNAFTNLIEVCPRNFPDTFIPERNNPRSIFAHELAHAVDYTVNENDLSRMKLKDTIQERFPVINSENINEVKTALENATKLYDKDFKKYYPTEKLIDSSYNINLEVRAAEEFVSFFAQSVSECLHKLKKGEDFGTTYEKYIQKQISQISSEPTNKNQLFALDVMSNCSQAYISRFTDPKVQELFKDVNKVIEEKRKELKANERQLERSTVTQSTPKAYEKEKDPNPTPTEEEAKNKAAEELIEKIKSGEVGAVVFDINYESPHWERDSEVYNNLNKAAEERNAELMTTAKKADPTKKYLRPSDGQVLIISKDYNTDRLYKSNPKLNLIVFDEYLDNYLKEHLTLPEKEAISESKTHTTNITTSTTTSMSEASANATTKMKEEKNEKNDQHLTRTEKENIKNFVSQEELNETEKYNLNDRLAAVNDNKDLLEKINKTAAITANVGIKAIDAEKSVEAEKIGTVKVKGEDNHLTDHANNTKDLIVEIQSGKIDKNTVIAIERKQYGENQGMKDIIKIAHILEHNEKNPDNLLKLPKGFENTFIYQDALLYKAAKENGITVISLEGRNLEHTKDSALYNKNREQHMANVINEVRSKGYNVIASVGSSHTANLEKALKNQQKHDTGFSNITRKIQQKPQENNQKEVNDYRSISKKVLKEASAIVQQIPAGMVSIKSVDGGNISQRQSLTNTPLKKSSQSRGKKER
ncbi:MAG TPA: hypothetical protein LFW21_02910 [Rickettsia endosymbiont of Pyrocoelia pectoralis]|nr:hypothetical protein [Rickettsia endosymbiont of Pyrocoelia pectoralis]